MSSFDQSLDDIKKEKQNAADEMEKEAQNIKDSKEIIRVEKSKIKISGKKIDALEQIMLACDAKIAAKEKIDKPEVSSLAFSNIIGIGAQQTKLKESKKISSYLQEKEECRNFKNYGYCKWGENCHYSHAFRPNLAGRGRGRGRGRGKRTSPY